MKNKNKSRMIFRFFLMVCGMVLWAMIEALDLGSFMFIFPAALILFSFDKIRKEIMSEMHNGKPLAESVRVVKIKELIAANVTNYHLNHVNHENSEYFNNNPKIKICM